MRFILRSLLFAAGFLVGGEALRRWLEQNEPTAPEPRTTVPPTPARTPPATPAPAATPTPTPTSTPAPASESDLESMSRAELYKRAREIGLEGRSKMTKADLAAALRASGRAA